MKALKTKSLNDLIFYYHIYKLVTNIKGCKFENGNNNVSVKKNVLQTLRSQRNEENEYYTLLRSTGVEKHWRYIKNRI